MTDARFVRLEGLDAPCLLLSTDGEMPEELVVEVPENPADLAQGSASGASHAGAAAGTSAGRKTVFRLQPTSTQDACPVYVEVFDE